MNYFICKCINNQNEDEKMAIDLLNIKNLEMTLKNNENKISKTNTNIDLDNNLIEQLLQEENLEIIEYPYSFDDKNHNNKKDKNQNFIHFINKQKKKIINNNILFNKDTNFQKNIKNNYYDSDSSSLNNESIIIDNIEYLNDEDIVQMPENKIKKNINNIYNKSNARKKFMKSKTNNKVNKCNIINSYKTKKGKNGNSSLRSNNTTKESTSNNSKRNSKYNYKEIKIS